jgi:glycolate oxidase FAD binding subunit
LTEVSLRVQALPEAEITLTGPCNQKAGLAALRKALRSPFDISGAAYDRGLALIRLDGMAGSVAYRAAELTRLLGGAWGQATGVESANLWHAVRDVTALQDREGSVWRVVVKQTEAGRIAQALGGDAVFDWGGGLLWLLVPGGMGARLRATVGEAGHAVLMRPSAGDETTQALPPEADAVAALTAAIRAKFDPRQLFAA